MKKQKVILVLVCILLVTGVMLQAKVKTGRAIIPHFSADYPGGSSSNIPYFFCTNITDDDITVTYVFYKDDGTLLQDSGNSSTTGPIIASFFSGTYSETVSGTSVSFVLGAHKSAQIRIENTGGQIIGHGYVEWEQDSKAHVGLVCSGRVDIYYTDSRGMLMYAYNIDINNSLPF